MQTKIMVVLLIIAAVVVGLGLYLLSTNNRANNAGTPTPTPTATPTATVTATPTPTGTANSKSFTLTAQNNSGQSGTVLLEEVGAQVRVTITVESPVSNLQPAHIHTGRCPNPGAVEFPLTDVSNGSSVTLLDTSFEELDALGNLAVNIHKSAAESGVYYSCGNLDF